MLKKLRKLIVTGDAEVEDVLACVRLPSSLADDLAAIEELLRKDSYDLLIPWVVVVVSYVRSGLDGLRGHLGDLPDYVVGVLAEVGGDEALNALATFLNEVPSLGQRKDFWGVVNQVASFSRVTVGDEASRERLREEAHRVVQEDDLDAIVRVNAVYALRGIGNAESLAALLRVRRFAPPFEDARDDAVKAVRKRVGASR